MRSTLTALVVAAGVMGFGAAAQAAPVPAGAPGAAPIELAQLSPMERRMVRRRAERRMIERRVERRMIRRQVRRDMRRRW